MKILNIREKKRNILDYEILDKKKKKKNKRMGGEATKVEQETGDMRKGEEKRQKVND